MRPNDTTIYIDEFIDKIKTILNNYKDYIGQVNTYTTDDVYIPKYPAITIELDNWAEEWKEIPRRKTLIATFAITYYYQQLSTSIMRTELRKGLNKICNVLRENWTLDGYTPTLGSTVISATPYVLARGEEIVAGGVITFECRKIITIEFA